MNVICPSSITCPGSDSPILNLSSESPDQFLWWTYTYPIPPCSGRLVCDPTSYYSNDCFGVQYSADSQTEADLLAQQSSVNCENNLTCVNEEQVATVTCLNGNTVSFVVPAGTFSKPNTGDDGACLAAANAQAEAYALQQASQLAQTQCDHSETQCIITSNSPMANGTVGTAYSVQLVGSVSGTPVVWSLLSGSLPSGLALNTSGKITGTPTTAGTSTFTVKLKGGSGATVASCSKEFQITVNNYYFAYFKLDETTGALTLTDQISAFNLSQASGTFTSVAGKIATAMNLGNGINTQFVNGPNSHFVFSGNFSVRIWFKKQTTASNLLLFGLGNQWKIYYLANSGLLEFVVKLTSGDAFVDTPVLVDGAWNHIVFWFEQGVGVGCRINDATTITGAGALPIQSYVAETLYLENTNFWDPGNVIDEIAIWDHKLTSAEITADWYGGAGKTYP